MWLGEVLQDSFYGRGKRLSAFDEKLQAISFLCRPGGLENGKGWFCWGVDVQFFGEFVQRRLGFALNGIEFPRGLKPAVDDRLMYGLKPVPFTQPNLQNE